MKKIAFILITALLVISCTEDEELERITDKVTANDISHTWNVTDFYTNNGKIKTMYQGINVNANFTSQGKDFDTQISFNQNPNTVISEGNFTNVYTVNVGISFSEERVESFDFAGQWSITDNVISITSGNVTSDYEIVEFTSSILKLKFTVDEYLEITEEIEGDATAIFYIELTR